ncbi:MAG TPA: hypothetical protein VFP77_09585, partial [Gemmatimonadaceae bacterium]|nr:hypothetical protein [Gemmatimonadaceae bacterium]
MPTAATLAVKIVADISDLEKNFSKADRAAMKFGDDLAAFGKRLTLGITLPVAAVATGLAKMAAENEDTAGRMSRVFGSMTQSIENSITSMMKSVPEARTDLEKMAISIDNMLQGMSIAPGAAANMSASILKLAGDVSAFAHVPMDQALDALERGLAGKTKGLLDFGIAISGADIKQKAFQMGILTSGHELTEAGTAMAAYALITERTSRIQDEAARTADQQGKQFAFLKRDLQELADQVSSIVLPSMSEFARSMRDLVADLAKVPPGITKVIFEVAGITAVVIPATYGIGKLITAFVTLKGIITTVSAGGGIAAIFTGLTNPIGQITLAIAGLTAAIAAAYAIWKKFHPDTGSALSTDPSLDRSLGLGAGIASPGAGGGPLQFAPGDALSKLKESAGIVSSAFDAAAEHGTSLVSVFQQVNALHADALRMITAQGGAFTKEREGAQEVADQMQRLKDITAVAMAPGTAA